MIAYLFVFHFIADFLLQSREMGSKKSSEFKWLLKHLSIQFEIFLFGLIAIFILTDQTWFSLFHKAIPFVILNTLIHGVIDWFIWKGYKATVGIWMKNNPDHEATKLYLETGVFKFWEDKLFFDTIGFDQLLHALTIILLAGWLL